MTRNKNYPLYFRSFFITVGLNWFLLPHDIASAGVGAIGHLVETAFLSNAQLLFGASIL